MQKPLLTILDNIEVLVYVADLKTYEILYVNEYTRRIFGDIKGNICWQSLQVGQDGPCSFCTNDKIVTAEGKPTGVYHWEFQNTISGKWFDIRDSAIDWEDGRTVRLEVAMDITERKKAEEELYKSQHQYQSLIENIPSVTWITDITGKTTFISSNIKGIYGYTPEDIYKAGESLWFERIHDEDIADVKEAYNNIFSKSGNFDIEYRIKRKDGEWIWLHDRAVTIYEKKGVKLAYGVFSDITERKKAEEKIRRSAEELTALLKVSHGLATTLDLEKVLQMTINEAVKLTGLGSGAIYLLEGERLHLRATTPPLPPKFPEELCFASLDDHPHIRQAVITRRSLILDDTAKADLTPEEQIVTKLRGLRTILYVPLIVEDKVLGVFIVCSVEEPLVISEDIINLSHTLANQSALAIQNAQFYKHIQIAYKELTSKNKELEQVLYVTSHDLRSPLVNVEGYSKELVYSLNELMSSIEQVPQSLKDKITTIIKEDIPESLHYIQTSVVKMSTLLKGILTLSRLGQYKLTIDEIDMNEMMTDIVDNHRFRLSELRIKTEMSKLPYCKGDSFQINQVFSNLMDNAIKYSDSEKSCVINISGYKDKNHSVYCIEDNGLGIAPEHQNRIFEIFHQLEPDRFKGEGMGLTIAHKILEKHNGKIWVESELGKGCKFFVSLPS